MSNTAPGSHSPHPSVEPTLRLILESAVGKRSMPKTLDDSTPLLGSVPELDSMAVLSILTQLQEDLGCAIEDDEVEASVFETFGSLRRFVESKLG
jgi:acyl carrier protein